MGEVEKFVKAEQSRLAKERADYMKEHDMEEFYQFPVGTTAFVLEPKVPRAIRGTYGGRMAFRIEVDGKAWDWAVNPRSPIYRQLVEELLNAPVGLQIVRTGEKKQTRYDLVWPERD